MTIEIFQGHNVRIENQDDKLWYNINDVCAILEHQNPRVVASRLRG